MVGATAGVVDEVVELGPATVVVGPSADVVVVAAGPVVVGPVVVGAVVPVGAGP